ncbi:FAD-dependent oxidoreductase [Olivibacter sp. SA151]|uniref:FAD-dependent oxidoreductase n=1 Tax=Olivibacter jilunii TaxID=985016 RepID=UPI003F17547E
MVNITSVWKDNSKQGSFPILDQDLTVDVAIIGGGITGITAAYLLAKQGKKVTVLEARAIGEGSTGFSTGNLYAIPGSEGLHTIEKKWGKEHARQVVESRAAAIDFIEARIQEFNINCGFVHVPWCLFSEQGESASYIQKEREAVERAGLTTSDFIPFDIKPSVGFSIANQAQFNPLQYTVALAQHIQSDSCLIFEHTKMMSYEEGEPCTVITDRGKITATEVIMATHTPKGLYFVHSSMEPYREYAVAATLNDNYPPNGTYWDMISKQHYSIRTYDTAHGKVLMVLGEKHKVGTEEHNESRFRNLENFLRERFNVNSVVYSWAAQQYKPADGIPYIGKSSGSKKTYIATGFSADGLVYGTLAAIIISAEIIGNPNPWNKLYDASRITPIASAANYIKANASVTYELIKDYLFKENVDHFSEIKPTEGKIMEIKGQKCAVSRNRTGDLFIVSAVCPHMGCIVHWNSGEQSWDCPCHGSRFTTDGEVIEGPAISALAPIHHEPSKS